MLCYQRAVVFSNRRHALVAAPGPGVPEPKCWQNVDLRAVRAGVADCDSNQDLVHAGLRVVGSDLPVPIVVEDAGIEKLELRLVAATAAVLLDQLEVGKCVLRIEVPPAHPRVSGSRVEVKPVFLGILAMVALVAGQPEDPFFEDWVAAIPESKRKAKGLPVVTETRETVLVPAVNARASVVVRKEFPGLAGRAVVLAHGPPGPLAEIWTPPAPRRPPRWHVLQTPLLGSSHSENCAPKRSAVTRGLS